MAIPSFFRSDGWVKSTLGPAVSGALVYVVQQPANVPTSQSPIPPSPLANIFSDPNGLSPITQPVQTDGFGHYDFYVAPGTYTVAVYLNNKLMNTYLDQSIGQASSGQTLPQFLVNNSTLSSQTRVNYIAGSNITLADGGNGNITISGSAAISLQVNNVALSSQTTLNISNGSNVTVTDSGAGKVTIAATGIPAFGTSGQGWFPSNYGYGYAWSPGGSPTFCINASGGNTVNSVQVFQITLPYSITVRKFTTSVGIGSSGHAGMGIYDANGNLLVSGVVSTTNSGSQTVAVTATTIGPGIFYTAITGDTTGASCASGFLVSVASASTGITNDLNNNVVRTGVAANTSSAGVLPATLGAISKWTFSSSTNIAGFLIEA